MDLIKYVKLEDGEIKIDLKGLVIPVLEGIKADLESGKIDPIKGTDLDKMALEIVISQIEKQLA